MFSFLVQSPEETIQFAKRFADELDLPITILLDGELGAGKTTFVKGLANGLNIHEIIKSPTYTFIKEYTSGRMPLYHMDVYRLEETGGEGLGFEDYFDRDGVCVVEWAQFIAEQLPESYVIIRLLRTGVTDDERQITIEAIGKKAYDFIEKAKLA